MPGLHAKLSPSAHHRWSNCPGSVAMSDDVEEEASSPYAVEGTAAHKLAEMTLQAFAGPLAFIGQTVEGVEVTPEMAEAVNLYVTLIRERTPLTGFMKLEQRVTLEHDLRVPIWGTADCLIWNEDARTLTVVDLKFGRGLHVDASSGQLAIYALGALAMVNPDSVDVVECVVVQPRRPDLDDEEPGVRVQQYTTTELAAFADDLVDQAQAALSETATLKPGHWCRFCRAKAFCEPFREQALRGWQDAFAAVPIIEGEAVDVLDPKRAHHLSGEELGALLGQVAQLETLIRAVREEATNRLTVGQDVVGFKLVAKRAARHWRDEEEAAFALAAVLPRTALWRAKLASPAQVEAAAELEQKDAVKALVAEHAQSISSGWTLAPAEDRRMAKPNAAALFADAPALEARPSGSHDDNNLQTAW